MPAAGGPTRWMDLGDTRDALLARVAWTPDSRQVFAQRLNRMQNRLDLMSADAAFRRRAAGAAGAGPATGSTSTTSSGSSRTASASCGAASATASCHLYLYGIDGKPHEAAHARGVGSDRGGRRRRRGARASSTSRASRARSNGSSTASGLDGKRKRRITAAAGTHAISMSPDVRLLPGHVLQPDRAAAAHPARTGRRPRRASGAKRPRPGIRDPAHRDRAGEGGRTARCSTRA